MIRDPRNPDPNCMVHNGSTHEFHAKLRKTLVLLKIDAREMFAAFFPGVDSTSFEAAILPRLPMAAAELQDIMLAMAEGECPVLALQAELARRVA